MVVLLVAAVVALSGCAATGVAISKHELDVLTTMTDSIFLDPPMPGHNKVLVQIRNTSDKSDFAIEPQLKDDLRQRGWTITENPAEADYMLQANVLKAEKMNKTAANQMFGSSYGGSLGVGALDPVLDAHARFDASVEDERSSATEPQWPRINPSWAAF